MADSPLGNPPRGFGISLGMAVCSRETALRHSVDAMTASPQRTGSHYVAECVVLIP
ncbi:MAG: hypothetical protein Q8N96_13635 [Methylovulum sp.]|nr:hypothetical protein [Methylovulum sp.]